MRLRRAISVVEVLVALVVFSVAALGSAAALHMSARAQSRAVARREAVDVMRWQAALVGATSCDSLTSGHAIVRGVEVEWDVVVDSVARVRLTARHRGTVAALHGEISCE